MREWRLKAPDEATALQVGSQLGEAMGLHITRPATDEEGEPTGATEWISAGHRHFLLRVGTRYNDDGEYDEEGNTVTPPTPMDGWWCNLRVRDEIADQVGKALQQAAEAGVIEVESTGHEIA